MDRTEYTVTISPKAAQMMVEHAAFLAQVSTTAAEKLLVSFQTAANLLRDMPHRCAWLSVDYMPHNKYRFLLFEGRYMLIFQVRDNKVFVDYVLDCRRDYTWLVK